MINAHQDQVQVHKTDYVILERGCLYGVNEKGKLTGLGADDKNGVWICLNLLLWICSLWVL